jgi:hypothetical protein
LQATEQSLLGQKVEKKEQTGGGGERGGSSSFVFGIKWALLDMTCTYFSSKFVDRRFGADAYKEKQEDIEDHSLCILACWIIYE